VGHELDFKVIVALDKMQDAIRVFEAALSKTDPFESDRRYSLDELEPYDVLGSRFVRAVEVAIMFIIAFEMHITGQPSDMLRCTLLKMEEAGFVSSAGRWIEMRDVRYCLAHDDMPKKVKETYDAIMGPYADELRRLAGKVKEITI
jgi:hypothetical protein